MPKGGSLKVIFGVSCFFLCQQCCDRSTLININRLKNVEVWFSLIPFLILSHLSFRGTTFSIKRLLIRSEGMHVRAWIRATNSFRKTTRNLTPQSYICWCYWSLSPEYAEPRVNCSPGLWFNALDVISWPGWGPSRSPCRASSTSAPGCPSSCHSKRLLRLSVQKAEPPIHCTSLDHGSYINRV